MCANRHRSVAGLLNQYIWVSVKVTSPDIRACVLFHIVLYLSKCDKRFVFIAMFGVARDNIEGVAKIILLALFSQSDFDCGPIKALLWYESIFFVI